MGRIVVADDDADIRNLVGLALRRGGHEVLTAADGAAAVAAFVEHAPDLVILDVMMPVMDGLAAAREIRSHDSGGATPILMLTARAQDSDFESGLVAGATDYIVKPFSPRALAARVDAVLARTTP